MAGRLVKASSQRLWTRSPAWFGFRRASLLEFHLELEPNRQQQFHTKRLAVAHAQARLGRASADQDSRTARSSEATSARSRIGATPMTRRSSASTDR